MQKRGAGKARMRKGMDGLAMLAQKVLEQDPFSGHLFVFRGRAANLIMWDGNGLCLFTKRLECDQFLHVRSVHCARGFRRAIELPRRFYRSRLRR